MYKKSYNSFDLISCQGMVNRSSFAIILIAIVSVLLSIALIILLLNSVLAPVFLGMIITALIAGVSGLVHRKLITFND